MKLDQVFRVRRHQASRLEGFVDASFAFAVTILIISFGHVPASVPEMLHAFRGVPAFAVSFLLLVRFWKVHRDWSRHFDIEDNTAIALSLTLVFLVLIFVYPLRFIFSLLFAWLSDSYLMDQPIEVHSIDEYRMAFEVYGVAFACIALIFVLMYRHALRCAATIGLDARETLATRMEEHVWWALGAVALASAASAALLPFEQHRAWLFAVPGSIYALLGVFAPAIRRHYARRIDAIGTPA